MKRPKFANGQYYHIYNRGVDKRNIFLDLNDVNRFFTSMEAFNSVEPIGSLYELSFNDKKPLKQKKLVEFVSYCLNPNHYHFIVKQVSNSGISEFMKRLGGGYTWYFNNRYKRTGSLFQGLFKAVHVEENKYLLHLSAYVNLNFRVHKLGGETAKFVKSSWEEYLSKKVSTLKNDIVLKQFSNSSEYKKFAEDSLKDILERKQLYIELQKELLE